MKLAFVCVCSSLSFNALCHCNSISQPAPLCWHSTVRTFHPIPETTDVCSVHPFSLLLLSFRKSHLQNYTGCHLWSLTSSSLLGFSGSIDVTEHVTSLSLFIICCIERVKVCLSFHCWMTPGCHWRLYCAYWTCLFLFPFWALLTAFQNQTFLFSLCVFLLHNCLPWALHLGSHSEKEHEGSIPRP